MFGSSIFASSDPARARDDRETPLMWDETVVDIAFDWGHREQEYFCKPDWTAQIRLIRFNKSRFAKQGGAVGVSTITPAVQLQRVATPLRDVHRSAAVCAP